jgi:hypothetical protein
MLQEE